MNQQSWSLWFKSRETSSRLRKLVLQQMKALWTDSFCLNSKETSGWIRFVFEGWSKAMGGAVYRSRGKIKVHQGTKVRISSGWNCGGRATKKRHFVFNRSYWTRGILLAIKMIPWRLHSNGEMVTQSKSLLSEENILSVMGSLKTSIKYNFCGYQINIVQHEIQNKKSMCWMKYS